jgi:hypothetical protein
MKRITSAVVVLGFALASSTAFATQAKPQPVQMNDAQLDSIAAGQIQISDGLVNVTVGDITVSDIPVNVLTNSINNNVVRIPVDVAANVNAVVAALGNAAGFAQQLGRQ